MSTTTSEKNSDSEQWKEKYRDAVRELDAKESRWRDGETHLHKALLRLSFSYLGLNPGLDRQLKELQSALKKNPDPASRTKLIDEIVEQITRIKDADVGSGALPGTDPSAIVAWLAENLHLPDSHSSKLDIISSKLRENDEQALKRNTGRLADLINEVIEQAQETSNTRHGDTFIEFLQKFSLPGSLGDKVTSLQMRSLEIKTDLERLAVIDDTIAFLTDELDRDLTATVGTSETQAIVRELIEWMTLPSQVKEELQTIQAQLEGASCGGDLSTILRDLGYTVSQFHRNLMSELTDVEYYLKNIAIRLKELQLGIEDAFNDQRDSLHEQENLNTGISEKVSDIATKLAQEDDLGAVKRLIDQGMSDIRVRMQEHLTRDRQRVAEGENRLQEMSKQLKTMDEESTRLRAQVRHERKRAQHDALTGIPNRAAYDARIRAESGRTNRHNRPLSLAVIDIDKFKDVNDRFGHKAGDKVLKNVAEICAANVRSSDFLARYGGEEFVLLLPETDIAQAYNVAEKLRSEIASKGFYYDSRRVPITISIGIAEFVAEEDTDTVFQRADQALYAAKQAGRNRCFKGQ